MNVLIVDTDKIDLTVLRDCFDKAMEISKEDYLVLPKGIDIIQDISVDWMKMIRDVLDEKIKALENNTK